MDAADLLVSRMRERRVIPFVGAGLSTGLAPNWRELLQDLWTGPGDFDALWVDRGPTVVAELLASGTRRGELARATAEAIARWRRANPAKKLFKAAHAAIATGPWPAIVTTNWDDALERAWERRGPHLRYAHTLPVRYRRDARRFYAEVKAGVRPGPLLKLHGDLLDRRDEFVLGHGDYRRLMTRDVELRSLVRWMASEYSFLFFGTSLTDPDLLAWLDETHESLGHAVGPHFWLTAEDVHPRLEAFLLATYGIRMIRRPKWQAADALVERLAREATAGIVSDVSMTVGIGAVRVRISSTELPLRGPGALAVSVGTAAPSAGEAPLTLAGATFRAVFGVDVAPRLADARPGRAVRWPDDAATWLLFGQAEGAYGRTGFVHGAVLDFLRQAVAAGFDEAHLPLVAGGGGRLSPHDALSSELHAIGRFAAEAQREVAVHVHLPSKPPPTRLLLADIADGRIAPAAILDRGRRGIVRATVIYPTRSGDLVALPVLVPADGTAAALLEALVDAAEPEEIVRFHDGDHVTPWDPDAPLASLHVTDGCIVVLQGPSG